MPLLGPSSTRGRSIRPPAGCGDKRYVVSRTWSRSVEQCPFQRLQPVASTAAADPAEGPSSAAGALASHLSALSARPALGFTPRYEGQSCGVKAPEQRTSSTFSCDIAYSDSPTASRA